MTFEIYYIISSSAYIVTIVYTIYQLRRLSVRDHRENIRREVREYIMSEEFKDVLMEAINQSDMNKKLSIIVLALCTHVPEIKKSKICDEGI
jgi:hypothetical protein